MSLLESEKMTPESAKEITVPIGIVSPQICIMNVRSLSPIHLLQSKVTADRKIGYERLIIPKPAKIQVKLSLFYARILTHPPKIRLAQAILNTMLGLRSLNNLMDTNVIGM